MEPHDGSILSNKMQHIFQQHRGKNSSDIFTPDSSFTADSGYLTTTHNSTPNISGTLSISSLSNISTPRRVPNASSSSNNNISSVSENVETVDKTKLTPVTENIRNICNFHITTPKDSDRCVPGSKRNAAAILNFSNFESTPKKSRIDESLSDYRRPLSRVENVTTPRKIGRGRSKMRSFRKKLHSAPDLKSCFDIENEQSPGRISAIRSGGSRTPLSSSSSNLQRMDTPRSTNKHTTATSDLKPSVKKLLTFSDSQFDQLMKSDAKTFQTKPLSSSTKLEDKFQAAAAAEPLTSVPGEHFETFCDNDLELERIAGRSAKQVDSVITVLRDRELARRDGRISRLDITIDSFTSPKASFSIEPSTSTAALESVENDDNKTETKSQELYEMDISPMRKGRTENELDFIAIREKTPPLPNYAIQTTSDLYLNVPIKCDKQIEASNFNVPLPRTPKKASKSTTVEHERLGIIYPTIPRTPSKYSRRLVNKRKSVVENNRTISIKRKYYGGIMHLNMIAKLQQYGHLLAKIFDYLTSQDLANMCEVSRSWRLAVQSNQAAWHRVHECLRIRKGQKENVSRIEVIDRKILQRQYSIGGFGSGGGGVGAADQSYQKIPFNQNNFRVDRKRSIDDAHSPPVSPSKRKFHDNQKIVRTLAPDEKLIKCPRCKKSSRIYNTLSYNRNHHSTIKKSSSVRGKSHVRSLSETFQQTATAPGHLGTEKNVVHWLTGSTITNPTISRIPRVIKSLSFDLALPPLSPPSSSSDDRETSSPPPPQYAECTGRSCMYRFCLDCFCDYHPGEKCKFYEPSSPSKDDSPIRAGSSRTDSMKTRRRSLKRLCF